MSFFGFPRAKGRARWQGWGDSPTAEPGSRPEGTPDDPDDDYDRWDDDYRLREFMSRFGRLELHQRSFTQRIETGAEAQIRVENRNGRTTIRTHDEPAIVIAVEADIYADSPARADAEQERIERGITSEGNRVSVVAPELNRPEWFFFGRGPKIDYEIRVPASTQVWVSSRNGPISLTGTRGRARIENRNGRVTVERVDGELDIESRNGRLTVTDSTGPARVAALNGAMTLDRIAGPIEVESKNGTMDIQKPGGSVKARTVNGPIRFEGRVNGDLELEAANGGIRVAVTADSRFELDAESRHGSTRSDLPVRDRRPAEGSGAVPKVRIRTVNGSIRILEA